MKKEVSYVMLIRSREIIEYGIPVTRRLPEET
jgi:hypothetical protein